MLHDGMEGDSPIVPQVTLTKRGMVVVGLALLVCGVACAVLDHHDEQEERRRKRRKKSAASG